MMAAHPSGGSVSASTRKREDTARTADMSRAISSIPIWMNTSNGFRGIVLGVAFVTTRAVNNRSFLLVRYICKARWGVISRKQGAVGSQRVRCIRKDTCP